MNKYLIVRVYRFLSTVFLGLFFIPSKKEPRIILMSSFKGDFTSNSKYLFEKLIHSTRHSYEIKFLIGDAEERNYLSEKYGDYFIGNSTLGEKIYCLKSKVWVCSYFDLPVQGVFSAVNRTVIHLGHGVPVKASGLLENNVNFLKVIYYFINKSNFTYHFAPTQEVVDILSRMFGCSKDKFVLASQLSSERVKNNSKNRSDKRSNKPKKILYAPTWRGKGKDFFFKFDDIDLTALDEFLKRKDYLLCFRPHPLFLNVLDFSLFESITMSDMNSEPDINDSLHEYDIIISDYSSIIIDYLVLDRPILINAYDYDEFYNDNGFSYDFNEFCPGRKITSQKELIDELTLIHNGFDSFKDKRQRIAKRFGHCELLSKDVFLSLLSDD